MRLFLALAICAAIACSTDAPSPPIANSPIAVSATPARTGELSVRTAPDPTAKPATAAQTAVVPTPTRKPTPAAQTAVVPTPTRKLTTAAQTAVVPTPTRKPAQTAAAPTPTTAAQTVFTPTPTRKPAVSPTPKPEPLAAEERPILALDVERRGREETIVTVGVRVDGERLGSVAPAPGVVWSPDGARFAYTSGDGVSVEVAALGGEVWTALDSGDEWHPMYQWPAWSPDGKLIAAVNVDWCEVGMRVSSIEIIDALDGGSVARHGPYDFWQADGTIQGPQRFSTPNNISWSRDGGKLLVSWDKVAVIDAVSGKPQVVTSKPSLAEWAPTSDAVYYFEIEKGERSRRNRTLGALYVRRLESDAAEMLLSAAQVADMGLADEWGPVPGVMSLSPSGSTLAVGGGRDSDGFGTLHLFDVSDGTGAVSALDSTRYPVHGGLVALDWSPRGDALAGLVVSKSGTVVDMLDLAAGEWKIVTTSDISLSQVQFLGKSLSWTR